MKYLPSTGQKGFTLIETLVYIAVLVLIGIAIVMTYLSLDAVLLRNEVERELTSTAEFTLERMLREIREADSIDAGLSTLGSSPGRLTLETTSTTTTFSVSGGRVYVSVNGTSVGPLTPSNVTVQSLIFRRYQSADTLMIRIGLSLRTQNKFATTVRTYYTSAVLRGTYE